MHALWDSIDLLTRRRGTRTPVRASVILNLPGGMERRRGLRPPDIRRPRDPSEYDTGRNRFDRGDREGWRDSDVRDRSAEDDDRWAIMTATAAPAAAEFL